MAKMYFYNDDSEFCETIENIKDLIRCDELKEKEVFEAKRITGNGFFWCKAYSEAGESGSCGNICKEYKPRNGKNGRCIHSGYCYEANKKIIIKL